MSDAHLRAIVVPVLTEEAAAREGRGARAAREARHVEVLVRHAQHLAAALAAARAAYHLACKQCETLAPGLHF